MAICSISIFLVHPVNFNPEGQLNVIYKGITRYFRQQTEHNCVSNWKPWNNSLSSFSMWCLYCPHSLFSVTKRKLKWTTFQDCDWSVVRISALSLVDNVNVSTTYSKVGPGLALRFPRSTYTQCVIMTWFCVNIRIGWLVTLNIFIWFLFQLLQLSQMFR